MAEIINGVIPINKPKDWTSFDVVNKIKRMIYPKKVGHLGTLDPMATGVLLVTIGSATKLFDLSQQKTKTYIATFEFGTLTDSLDATGNVVATSDCIPTKEEIEKILPEFLGNVEQVPPKFSAKSINGKRAYELARQNKEFELKPKLIYIKSLELISCNGKTLKLKIECGSGTYIRAIGRDIAYKLNSYATMTELVRTSIDNIDLNQCYNITEIDKDNIYNKILPINDFLNIPTMTLESDKILRLLNGQTLNINLQNGLYKLNENGVTRAVVEINNKKAKMKIFFG